MSLRMAINSRALQQAPSPSYMLYRKTSRNSMIDEPAAAISQFVAFGCTCIVQAGTMEEQ
jgi:hypothetical protein